MSDDDWEWPWEFLGEDESWRRFRVKPVAPSDVAARDYYSCQDGPVDVAPCGACDWCRDETAKKPT